MSEKSGLDEGEREESPVELSRKWMVQSRHGTLGTVSVDDESVGWPFLSVVPYALTVHGQPFILTANIAQHTRNMIADKRVSLMIQQQQGEGDPQSGWRLTMIGEMEKIEKESVSEAEYEELGARYREIVPKAKSYLAMHGFDYWVLRLKRLRFIAGFGRITWIPGSELVRDRVPEEIAEMAPGIISHMNADHGDALAAMANAYCSVDGELGKAEMTALDSSGFFLRVGAELHYIGFGKDMRVGEARSIFVSLSQKARTLVEERMKNSDQNV
jgi:heme iron utilization protein